MSWCRGQGPRRLLSGLLVLGVVLMSVTQVNALMAPGIHDLVAAASAPSHHHDASAAAVGHDHDDHPCAGVERPHALACCLAGGCPLLIVALPSSTGIPMPSVPIGGVGPRVVAAQPDGIGRSPEPPPPRRIP